MHLIICQLEQTSLRHQHVNSSSNSSFLKKHPTSNQALCDQFASCLFHPFLVFLPPTLLLHLQPHGVTHVAEDEKDQRHSKVRHRIESSHERMLHLRFCSCSCAGQCNSLKINEIYNDFTISIFLAHFDLL
jgi:hypothetical protein